MFDLPKDKDDALRLAALAADALTLINNLVGVAKPDTAASILTVVKVILAVLEKGFEGKITTDQVKSELKKLTDSLAANDAAADATLEKKFKDKE